MKYDSYKMPDGGLAVRPTGNGSSGMEQMLADMTLKCTLTPSDARAFLSYLSSYLAGELANGRSVTLDEIGTFGISLSTATADESTLTGHDVRLKRVTFRAAPQLKHSIGDKMRAEHVRRDERHSSTPRYTFAQRRVLLPDVIASHPQFTAAHYRAVTHASATTASRDLRLFVSEGLITPHPIGSAIIYTSTEKPLIP